MKSKINYNMEVFLIAKDHLIVRFRLDKNCSMVLNDNP